MLDADISVAPLLWFFGPASSGARSAYVSRRKWCIPQTRYICICGYDSPLAPLPHSPNLVERLSGNSGQAPFHGPVSLHNGRKGTLLGASRYRQTRDPTRPATFQTVSETRMLGSSRLALCIAP